jgi:hypothetical protein
MIIKCDTLYNIFKLIEKEYLKQLQIRTLDEDVEFSMCYINSEKEFVGLISYTVSKKEFLSEDFYDIILNEYYLSKLILILQLYRKCKLYITKYLNRYIFEIIDNFVKFEVQEPEDIIHLSLIHI